MLYVMPAPMGVVTVMVPVAIVQVGCINVAVGATGVGGWALIVTLVPEEIHPSEFIAVSVYMPDAKALNIVLD